MNEDKNDHGLCGIWHKKSTPFYVKGGEFIKFLAFKQLCSAL